MKPVKVMEMAALAALLLAVNVSVRTLPLIEGAESVALPAVAEGELKAGEPDIVMTSLPLTGMASAGVMAMVTVKPVAPARTSGRVNEGPIIAPLVIGSPPRVFSAFVVSSDVFNLNLPATCWAPSVAPVHVTETGAVPPGLADNFIVSLPVSVTPASMPLKVYPDGPNAHAVGLPAKYVSDGNSSDIVEVARRAVVGVKPKRSSTLVEYAMTVGNNLRSERPVTAAPSTNFGIQQPRRAIAHMMMTLMVRT